MSRRGGRQSRRGIGNQGSGFDPLSISGCQLWLRADMGITIGTGVSAWADQSGLGNNVTQATGSAQPTFNASDANYGGQPTLSFAAASSQYLETAANFALTAPYTIIVVAKFTINGDYGTACGDASSTNGQVYINSGTNDWALYNGSNIDSGVLATSTSIACSIFGTPSSMFINDPIAAYVVGGTNGNTVGHFRVGYTDPAFGTGYWNGSIAEVLVYSGALTLSQRQQIFAYLGARYGIAIPAPITNPLSITGCTLWMDPTSDFVANTSWLDRSSQALSFAYQQETGSSAVAGTGINGRPTVDCAGTTGVGGGFTNASHLSALIGTSANAITALYVLRYTGNRLNQSGTEYLMAGIITDAEAFWSQNISTTTVSNGTYHSSWAADVATVATSTNYYIVAKYDGTKCYLSINGAPFDVGTAAAVPSTLTNSLVLASSYAVSGGTPFVGSLGDVIVYDALLTQHQISQLQEWVGARYGLPVI